MQKYEEEEPGVEGVNENDDETEMSEEGGRKGAKGGKIIGR